LEADRWWFGVGVVGDAVTKEIVATWLRTPFEGGQYAAHVRQIGEVEGGNED